jgi:SRSO17 transposase
MERAIQYAKGEAGLDEYEHRGWRGWHHLASNTSNLLYKLPQTVKVCHRV